MAIDRVKAIEYAKRFWNRPCDDGVFWLRDQAVNVEQKRRELRASARDGWEALFVADGNGGEKAVFQRTVGGLPETKLIQPWEGLADCAHFLSKCLQAGGIPISELRVPTLVKKLQERSDTKTLAEKVPRSQAQAVVNTGIFKKGDMIGYFNVDPKGDYRGAQNYSHCTMYAGKPNPQDVGRVTCHTIARFPGLSFVADEWFLKTGYTYTLIHFSNDDPPMANAASLAGWWKVEYGNTTKFYYIFKDGRARYTLRAPKSNQELHVAEGSAYWFQEQQKITFIWRKTGTVEVEVWTKGGNAREFSILVNNARGKSTKLF